jgi:hypothetical protein
MRSADRAERRRRFIIRNRWVWCVLILLVAGLVYGLGGWAEGSVLVFVAITWPLLLGRWFRGSTGSAPHELDSD